MGFVIKRNGTDITATIDWPTVNIKSILTKEVSTAQFDVLIPLGTSTSSLPVLGDQIDIYDQSNNHIFGGLVTESEATIPKGGLVIDYQITATDWGFKLDSKLVTKTYVNEDPADILNDIITNFASAGFTQHHVQRGNFLVGTIKFNYLPVTKAIEKLAKAIGWDWFVDPSKDLWFFQGSVDNGGGATVGSGVPAPFNIDLTTGNIIKDSLDIDYTIKNLKNSVYVIGSTKQTQFTAVTTPDVYTSVAGQLVYTLGYDYLFSTLSLSVDGVLQTVAELNNATPGSAYAYYQAGKPAFIQFNSDPGSGPIIKVYGTANVPIVAHVQNSASITTYGEIQDVITDTTITSSPEAFERAQADLLQFGHPVYDVKFNTRTPGLEIGQTIYLNLSAFGITNYPLVIKSVQAIGYTPFNLLFQVEAIGSDTVTFVDIMTTLLLQEQATTDTDNTVLQVLESIEEGITLADVLTATSASGPYKYGAVSPNPKYNFAKYS
jgi:hypothetical protein